MSSKSIRLSHHQGKIFEASELIPLDIVEETLKMDKLGGGKNFDRQELASGRLDQEQLMILCDEYKNPELSTKSREAIREVLSLYGLKCPQSSEHDEIYTEEEMADDISAPSRFLTIDEIMDLEASRERTSKHISKL